MVTATPIQNRLSELFSLLRFLRIYPYNEQRSLTWGSENPELAIERLKTLLKFIMLRRHKDVLHLPKRTDIVMPIKFDDQDKAKYDQAKGATIRYLDDIISSETRGNGYVNAISKINALRMVCNLGCCTDSRISTSDAAPSESSSEAPLGDEDSDAALEFTDQPQYNDDLAESNSTCTICGILIMTSPSPDPDPDPDNSMAQRAASIGPAELKSSRRSTQCWTCSADSIGALRDSHGRDPILQSESQLLLNGTFQGGRKYSTVFSTKIKCLVSDLKTQRQAQKR